MPPLAGYATGTPHAIASITAVGQGSLTFVCSRTWARRKTSGASRLRVPPDELHGGAEPEPRDRRAGIGDEPAADEQPRAGMGVQHVPERLERELETVRLRLVAAEQHHRPGRRHRPRGERLHVDGVREYLPRAAGTPRNASEERLLNALW